MVIIVLLDKPEGGIRPIGLLPLLPHIWMRARRNIARRWELEADREYLYAGKGKGADIASWKQCKRAETAHQLCAAYGISLLDLVKAYERIRHWQLARDAVLHVRSSCGSGDREAEGSRPMHSVASCEGGRAV